jgi:hypothetical protein
MNESPEIAGLPDDVKYRIYIGDGVYAGWNGYAIVLTTENGERVKNIIYLEPEHYLTLRLWFENLTKRGITT